MSIKKIIKNEDPLFYLLLFGILGYLIKYTCNIVLTQYLAPSLYGSFIVSIRTLVILYSAFLLGTNKASKRFLSQYLHGQNQANLQHYIQWNIHLLRIPLIFCLTIAFASYLIMHALHFWHFKDIRSYHLAVYMFWVTPFAAVFSLLGGYLVAMNHPLFHKITQKMKYLFYMILIALFAFLFHNELDNLKLVYVILLSFIFLSLIEIGFIFKKSPALFQHILSALTLEGRPDGDQNWLSVSTHLGLSNLTFKLVCVADLIIVETFQSNINAIGFYAVAITIASSVLVVPSNIRTALKGDSHHLLQSSEGKQLLEKKLAKLNRLTLGSTLILCVSIAILAKPLLRHFGTLYLQAEPALYILTLGYAFGGFAYASATVLAYSGQESSLLKVSIFELLALVIVGCFLTYFYGMIGMAITTAIIITLKTICLHWVNYHKLKIKTYLI